MNIKATGLLTKSSSGETLDAYFPVIKFNDQKTDIQDINTLNGKQYADPLVNEVSLFDISLKYSRPSKDLSKDSKSGSRPTHLMLGNFSITANICRPSPQPKSSIIP